MMTSPWSASSDNMSGNLSLSSSWLDASSQLPSSPGVYWYLDGNDNVLYVGKAKNLKNRIGQYLKNTDSRRQIASLLKDSKQVAWQTLESELQALLVEAELIHSYQPSYNILLKDDKSSLYIAITTDTLPRIITLRKPDLNRYAKRLTTFGPFPSGYKVKQVLKLARKIFRWCDRPISPDEVVSKKEQLKPCFYTHIGLCAGACTGQVPVVEYQKMVTQLKSFLRGHTQEIKRQLRTEIQSLIQKADFEKAAILRDQLRAIEEVTSNQFRLNPDATLPVLTQKLEEEALRSLTGELSKYLNIPRGYVFARIEGYDISNIQGTNPTSSMVVALNGLMTSREYRHFGIKSLSTPNDYAMMQETLTRRQKHPEWGKPNLLLIDGGKGQLRAALSVWHWPGFVVSLAKDPDRLIIPILDSRKKTTYREIRLEQSLPMTRLLQSIRDESHRFAKRLHTIKRTKGMFE